MLLWACLQFFEERLRLKQECVPLVACTLQDIMRRFQSSKFGCTAT